MSVVVERGLARCPRCVAVADYTFVESGPNSVRYEVNCRKCGEAYREVNSPVAPDFTAVGKALALPAPDVGAIMLGRRRPRWLVRLEHARHEVAVRTAAALAFVKHPDWRRWLHRRPAEPPTPAIQP